MKTEVVSQINLGVDIRQYTQKKLHRHEKLLSFRVYLTERNEIQKSMRVGKHESIWNGGFCFFGTLRYNTREIMNTKKNFLLFQKTFGFHECLKCLLRIVLKVIVGSGTDRSILYSPRINLKMALKTSHIKLKKTQSFNPLVWMIKKFGFMGNTRTYFTNEF